MRFMPRARRETRRSDSLVRRPMAAGEIVSTDRRHYRRAGDSRAAARETEARKMTPFTETQATYHRRALREQAEAHGRMLGRLFALEIIGFALIIIMELLK
jgi:hypothetical protein